MSVFLTGFILSGGLIVAIGAQNAYVLKQGLLKSHVFVICLICALSDAILIALGTSGVGKVVERHPEWLKVIVWLGAIYLIIFGLSSIRASFTNESLETSSQKSNKTLKNSVLTVLALTFLNPHVYLDTFLLIGGISSPYGDTDRLYFTIGAISASFVWFFGLGYGARLLVPLFEKHIAWKILNIAIGLVMFAIAYQLLTTDLSNI